MDLHFFVSIRGLTMKLGMTGMFMSLTELEAGEWWVNNASNHRAQNVRDTGLRTEQILRRSEVECWEMGRFSTWHIVCIRRMSTARVGAYVRLWAEFNQNHSIK
jgi:hypothetical protein